MEIQLDSCDISDSSDSSDGRQEQTCLQDFATVCINNSKNLGFVGPWVCAVLFLFFFFFFQKENHTKHTALVLGND